jgi:predicted XRE-type DNA-binding protein
VLQVRANLMADLRLYIEKNRLTQAEAAKRLGIAIPHLRPPGIDRQCVVR